MLIISIIYSFLRDTKYFRYFPNWFRMSNIQQQRMVVEQLRREASIKRISVSQAVEDIKVS